jgi:ABC-type dipeptide/oligopeptide/nickel transport system permease component
MRGADYVVKRIGFAVMTIFVAATLNFVLFRTLPGSAVTDLSRVPHATPEARQAIARQFGLDKSKWEQYLIYLGQLARGNLGVSYESSQPVRGELAGKLLNTIPMVGLGTLLSIVLGVLTGVVSAARRRTWLDYGSVSTAMVFYSLPTQWLALVLILLFAGILPSGGRVDEFLFNPSLWTHLKDVGKHMILPAATIALVLYGEYTLIVRSAMLETLGEDYILTARAKGLPDRIIVWRHAFRNAMLPIITLMAISLGYVVAGSILVETVFSWPGIGRAAYVAVVQRDYPMLQGAFLVLTASVVFFNLVADLLYFKLDPRISE